MSIDAKWQNAADYFASLSAATSAVPPADAFTCADASLKTGVSRKTIVDRLNADVRAGKLETGMFLHKTKWTRFWWLAK